jgi:hypothetical protein
MNKESMKTNKFTDKQNTKISTNQATGSRHVSATTQRRQAIKTRNCLSSTELARQQAIKTRYCLSSAEPARWKAIKTRNCLSSAELARRRARPTETAKRLSTVLSLAPLGLSLARQNKHKPKKNKTVATAVCHPFPPISRSVEDKIITHLEFSR